MPMARPFEATSEWRATFYGQHQTFNLITTHALAAGNFAHDSFVNRRHKIYAFTVLTILALLQIQSAGNTISPFQIHPMTTKASVFGILGYCVAFRAWQCLPLYATQLIIAMAVFGSFSLASLLSLVLPHSWWPMKYIFYFLLVLVELHVVVAISYNKHGRRLILSRRSWRTNSAMHLLPLTNMDLNLIEYNA